MKVRVCYNDGHYQIEEAGLADVHIEIPDHEWRAYQAYDKLASAWHDRCRDLSNEQHDKEIDSLFMTDEEINAVVLGEEQPFDDDEFESGVKLTQAINEVIDEDTLVREALAPPEGAGLARDPHITDKPTRDTSGATIIADLEKRGWAFLPTGPNEYEWVKFRPFGRSTIARQGDETWAADLRAAKT